MTLIVNGYCLLSDLKARLSIKQDDNEDDETLARVITAVSRLIDKETGRFFYQKSAEARYFDAMSQDIVYIDDCISITSLLTDEDGDRTYERTWTASDFELGPYNAALEPEPEPYTFIQRTPNGDYYFPFGTIGYGNLFGSNNSYQYANKKSVKILGNWGWSACPAQIMEACLLQAARLFKRKDAPFGIMGSAEMGYVRIPKELDGDVKLLIDHYIKHGLA